MTEEYYGVFRLGGWNNSAVPTSAVIEYYSRHREEHDAITEAGKLSMQENSEFIVIPFKQVLQPEPLV